jgi:hypothetical protein
MQKVHQSRTTKNEEGKGTNAGETGARQKKERKW